MALSALALDCGGACCVYWVHLTSSRSSPRLPGSCVDLKASLREPLQCFLTRLCCSWCSLGTAHQLLDGTCHQLYLCPLCWRQAENAIGESLWSDTASYATQASVPAVPDATAVTAAAVSSSSIALQWTEPASNGSEIVSYQASTVLSGHGVDLHFGRKVRFCKHVEHRLLYAGRV